MKGAKRCRVSEARGSYHTSSFEVAGKARKRGSEQQSGRWDLTINIKLWELLDISVFQIN